MSADAAKLAVQALKPHLRSTLELIAAGYACKDIAARLYCTQRTVRARVETLHALLACSNAAQLTRLAVAGGLVDPAAYPQRQAGLHGSRQGRPNPILNKRGGVRSRR